MDPLPIQKRDMGIVGLVIVVSQAISGFQSSQTVSNEMSKFKDQFQQSQIKLEEYFVRKTDVNSLMAKLDTMNEQLLKMNEEMKALKSFVRDYALSAPGDDIVGCKNEATEGFKI